METMSVDPPTPRTGTVPRRAGVIPPIIKLLSCGWHPRATRGTSLPSTSPLGLVRHLPRVLLFSLFFLRPPFLPPLHPPSSIRLSSILVDSWIRCCARLPRKITTALPSRDPDYFESIKRRRSVFHRPHFRRFRARGDVSSDAFFPYLGRSLNG